MPKPVLILIYSVNKFNQNLLNIIKNMKDLSDEIIIGEFVSMILGNYREQKFREDPISSPAQAYLIPKNYQHVLAFIFAIKEINKNPALLPNNTLRSQIYDNAYNSWRTTWTTLDLLFLRKGDPLNYYCITEEEVMANIGGLTSENSIHMANILSTYKIPQVSYGSSAPILRKKIGFSSFYRMIPNEALQYMGIVQLLKYFGWNWLNSFLRQVHFNNNVGDEIFLDEERDLAIGYDLINLVTFPNESFQRVQVGRIDPSFQLGKEFIINASAVMWNPTFHQMVPKSTCVESCHPGQSKLIQQGKQICCYDCIPCPSGRISTQMGKCCESCQEEQYPNTNQQECIPKVMTYLSYKDGLGTALTSLALFLSLTTLIVMAIFRLHSNTPIVKANNWSITCILLTSLLLCFLCSLFFIGRPSKETCLLRQAVFGITFSVAVSCVLAKTITVVLAFVATKPGNKMRKWMGKRLAILVIVPCSLIQIAICAVWLVNKPSFPELEKHSQVGEILVKCNEGSEMMFYIVLGYMGLLAIVSFTVAFFARKLPDSFNEAKFITFSMLVFCSVWISFIPTYLSTKGKLMVAVEIFSILTSAFGLLSCIFLPKCYFIIIHPELNKKEQMGRLLKLGKDFLEQDGTIWRMMDILVESSRSLFACSGDRVRECSFSAQ
ncbi:vomeronasal type-2 receptor 26-like [Crotalus tigris]|uniref:vomeronasal type-2 receptor 26-like n=1 Tax=Crotalus tigris TaxID=88082 RepID=UPI00192F8286|nr:vomeronasal type-2 receptor 26-like [Crotalus tigris]